MLVCVLLLYPDTRGWDVRCGCVCSGSGFGCAPPLLAGVCGVLVGCCLATPVPWFVASCAVAVGRCCLAPALVPWLWPAACLSGVPLGPALVRRALFRQVALGASVGFLDAVVLFPTPGGLRPRLYWGCPDESLWWFSTRGTTSVFA